MGYMLAEGVYLEHYGVKGMKWGVRRQRVTTAIQTRKASNAAYKEKLANIARGSDVKKTSDLKRVAYRHASLSSRVTHEATRAARQILIADVLTGQAKYKGMSEKDINKRLLGIAKQTAVQVVTKSVLADRAAKNYDSSGNLKPGVKRGKHTQEDMLQKIPNMARAATRAAKLGRAVIGLKAEKVRSERATNEASYRKAARSGNILESRVDDVVWRSDDGKSTIITNPREGAKNVTRRKS